MERPEPKFVPGELVQVVGALRHKYMIGQRTVIRAAEFGPLEKTDKGWGYKSDLNASTEFWHAEQDLAPLPKDEPTTFDASIWQPEGVRA